MKLVAEEKSTKCLHSATLMLCTVSSAKNERHMFLHSLDVIFAVLRAVVWDYLSLNPPHSRPPAPRAQQTFATSRIIFESALLWFISCWFANSETCRSCAAGRVCGAVQLHKLEVKDQVAQLLSSSLHCVEEVGSQCCIFCSGSTFSGNVNRLEGRRWRRCCRRRRSPGRDTHAGFAPGSTRAVACDCDAIRCLVFTILRLRPLAGRA